MDSELGRLEESVDWACAEIDRLRVQRSALLTACKTALYVEEHSTAMTHEELVQLRAAIAKAEA